MLRQWIWRALPSAMMLIVAFGTIALFICCDPPPAMAGFRANDTCPLRKTECDTSSCPVAYQIGAPPQMPSGVKWILGSSSPASIVLSPPDAAIYARTLAVSPDRGFTAPIQLRI